MHSPTDHISRRRSAFGQPHPALERATESAPITFVETKAIGEMLAGLINDETALYAITREWRYDAAGRKFLRLHALLDEQFSEIGTRLTQLAARSRQLGAWTSTRQGPHATRPQSAAANDALQSYMLRELLGLHEALIGRLKHGSALASHDGETTELLTNLTANHEKDAFMLRALLWEVQNAPA